MRPTLYIEDYNDLSFVIRYTDGYYEHELKNLGGRWNPNLKGGAGWIFSKRQHLENVQKFVRAENRNLCCANIMACTIITGINLLFIYVFF